MPNSHLIAMPPMAERKPDTPLVVDGQPLPARHGRPGACELCRQSVLSHFDTEGRWVGCVAATTETVFMLVPVEGGRPMGRKAAGKVAGVPTAGTKTRPARLRYTVGADAPQTPPEALSDQRRRVYEAVARAGRDGVLARDIIDASGLSHGSVQQALSWLREHAIIQARHDD